MKINKKTGNIVNDTLNDITKVKKHGAGKKPAPAKTEQSDIVKETKSSTRIRKPTTKTNSNKKKSNVKSDEIEKMKKPIRTTRNATRVNAKKDEADSTKSRKRNVLKDNSYKKALKEQKKQDIARRKQVAKIAKKWKEKILNKELRRLEKQEFKEAVKAAKKKIKAEERAKHKAFVKEIKAIERRQKREAAKAERKSLGLSAKEYKKYKEELNKPENVLKRAQEHLSKYGIDSANRSYIDKGFIDRHIDKDKDTKRDDVKEYYEYKRKNALSEDEVKEYLYNDYDFRLKNGEIFYPTFKSTAAGIIKGNYADFGFTRQEANLIDIAINRALSDNEWALYQNNHRGQDYKTINEVVELIKKNIAALGSNVVEVKPGEFDVPF